jgi:hypothetical protein
MALHCLRNQTDCWCIASPWSVMANKIVGIGAAKNSMFPEMSNFCIYELNLEAENGKREHVSPWAHSPSSDWTNRNQVPLPMDIRSAWEDEKHSETNKLKFDTEYGGTVCYSHSFSLLMRPQLVCIQVCELHIAAKFGNRKKNSTVTDVYSSVWTAYHSDNR